MPSFATLFWLAASAAVVLGHGSLSPSEAVEHKRFHHAVRSELEEQCSVDLAKNRARHLTRRADTVFSRRSELGLENESVVEEQKDSTVVLTPETTQGPYHILGEVVRSDISEEQNGIPLYIHASFLDIKTCKPVQVWVDAWQCNSTGYYSGYIAETGAFMVGNTSQTAPPPNNTKALTPTSGSDPAFVAAFLDNKPIDNSTFLRGVWRSDENGELEMTTVFPGWYEARAQHFHIKVYEQGRIAKNGTFVAGTAHHTGQFFFNNKTLHAVAHTWPYNTNAIPWKDHIPNEQDAWYPYQDSSGYTADMSISYIDPYDITKGLVGSITIAINTTFTSLELSTYWNNVSLWDIPEPSQSPPSPGPPPHGPAPTGN